MKTSLVILAAGMGSRFGGLKQTAPFGINGESILDFSVYDSIEAGFSEVIFIIKKEIEHDFREMVGRHIEKKTSVKYSFQELSKLPKGFSLPENRVKPWGTAHALLCARNEIDSPFAIINADDYYGKGGFLLLHDHLTKSNEFAMAAYNLYNTLSEKGSVSRGICTVSDGYLQKVVEDTSITKDSGYADNTLVSMNMWGLNPSVFDYMDGYFIDFLKEKINAPKSEFFLPSVIDRALSEGLARVRVYETYEKWYGVTYREDTEFVRSSLQDLQKKGLYDGI